MIIHDGHIIKCIYISMVIICENHICWSYVMINIYDHAISSYMIIIYDHHTWSSYMRMIYDHHTWSSYMMIIYDHHTWSSFMIIIHDHHESIRVTCFKRGVAYGMEKYLEVIRTDKISIFAPITFIECSTCTPDEKKIQKKDTTTKHCIQCLQDKELACFGFRDKYNHRRDTCQDCRKPAGKASDSSIRWHDCMIELKRSMIQRHHAKKYHDCGKKKRLRQRSRHDIVFFYPKTKRPAATLKHDCWQRYNRFLTER